MCAQGAFCCRHSKGSAGSAAVEEAEAGCSLVHTAGRLHAGVHISPTFASLSLLATTHTRAPSSTPSSTHRTSLIAICTRPLCSSSDRITSSMPGWYLHLGWCAAAQAISTRTTRVMQSRRARQAAAGCHRPPMLPARSTHHPKPAPAAPFWVTSRLP